MTPKDPRDFNPKHRILGAIIVVSAAVIFVPMILVRRDAPAEPASGAPSAAAAGETKVVVTPVRPAPRAEPPNAETTPVPSNGANEHAAASAPAAGKPAAKPAEPKSADTKGWAVQVGTYANGANAARLEEQLKKHGHAVKAERVALGGGNATRLRVGPFRDKALALKAQGQIEKQTGVRGSVVAYP